MNEDKIQKYVTGAILDFYEARSNHNPTKEFMAEMISKAIIAALEAINSDRRSNGIDEL